ncbi:unnamed protein product [Cylindrotheca closterium]|uniref:N-acetyltransferase domain-containing protein n=1 Tax=Cylindrotheca closterium TaxID=2856 RepID=A0AAD2GAP7_9STRA|nr:unnamed protein product [Cylindrotheca closterium]
MKGFGLIFLLLILSLVYLDAFVPPEVHSPSTRHRHRSYQPSLEPVKKSFTAKDTSTGIRQRNAQKRQQTELQSQSPSNDEEEINDEKNASSPPNNRQLLTHADILWKLKPSRDVPIWKRIWLKVAANLIRLDCLIKKQELPLVLCPKGGQALLEAHYVCNDKKSILFPWRRRKIKIGRFGFTTMAGPSNEPIQETVHDLYGLDANRPYRVGAIIYMFVEEEYRKRDVGTLALQVISLIQSIQACDFQMLVVDDNGSGKLNDWYLGRGYQKAPKLQDMMGSPNEIHGTSMMIPTNRILPDDCQIQWW